jgi:hypothetical protein
MKIIQDLEDPDLNVVHVAENWIQHQVYPYMRKRTMLGSVCVWGGGGWVDPSPSKDEKSPCQMPRPISAKSFLPSATDPRVASLECII